MSRGPISFISRLPELYMSTEKWPDAYASQELGKIGGKPTETRKG